MIEIGKIISLIFIIIGTFLSIVTSIGLIRLPDIYTRSHAASKSATLGVLAILLGAFIYFLFTEGITNASLILAIIFVFITTPVSGHLMGRAAYPTNIPLWKNSIQDDLKEVDANTDKK